jgi:adenine-specific DNA-methyltransferase
MATSPTDSQHADSARNGGASSDYQHRHEAVQRPGVGVQQEFQDRRAAKDYRFDSSISPELAWDENAERDFAEWLLGLIEGATAAITQAENGDAAAAEAAFFADTPTWQGTGERFGSIAECVARLKSLTQPFLNWAGKAERQRISVPTIPLFVHERHSTEAILTTLEGWKRAGTQLDLFGDPKLDLLDQLDAYVHTGPWSNRLILGDSLQVMNSLLEYEGLGGQVQMIYMDPPYGVKFGSNFQPFVRKRDVKHGADEDMIREPEMVKAYRDTWELGLHSYLTVIRDRLLLARELLTESGSIFVQISDENVHHVREVMDEVFGSHNQASVMVFQKTTGAGSPSGGTELPPMVVDFLLWYCKDKSRVKYSPMYWRKVRGEAGASQYDYLDTGKARRRATDAELANPPDGARFFAHDNLTSQSGGQTTQFEYTFQGKKFRPKKGGWKTNISGMNRLKDNGRLFAVGDSLRYVRYFEDFPFSIFSSLWTDTVISGFGEPKAYVVQTSKKIIERCMLMTTNPGDLVFDPTCGSGTTAYVAEQWGRRWITCDTSRVPLALARQRLVTATFPWYQLKDPARGPAGGFVYERKQNRKGEEVGGLVPRITLKSIANDEEPETVTLVDRPEVDKAITRVCGRFSVEGTIQAASSMTRLGMDDGLEAATDASGVADAAPAYEDPRRYLDRMVEVLRRSRTLRLPGNESLGLEKVRALSGEDFEHLHAEATLQNGGGKRAAILFGPEHSAIGAAQVVEAHREAYNQGFDVLCIFGFAIDAKARELIGSKDDERRRLKLRVIYVNVTPDVVMSDLLKTNKASEIFSVTGLPDVKVGAAGKDGTGRALFRVTLRGLDIFRPHDLETESIDAENLPCWMLDTDYNGLVFMARQVFFPKTGAWDNLEKALRGRFEPGVWEHLAGTESEPFPAGEHQRVAVKVIDERGNELMVVKDLRP